MCGELSRADLTCVSHASVRAASGARLRAVITNIVLFQMTYDIELCQNSAACSVITRQRDLTMSFEEGEFIC